MSILEDFLATHQDIPADLLRNLELIRTLDCKLKAEQTENTALKTQYLSKHDDQVLKLVRKHHESMADLADEKLAIAKHLIGTIVAANQRLSASIKALEDKVRAHHVVTPQKKHSEVYAEEDQGTIIILKDFRIYEEDNPICICGESSYGDVVVCDNPSCSRELLRLNCVDIQEPRSC